MKVEFNSSRDRCHVGPAHARGGGASFYLYARIGGLILANTVLKLLISHLLPACHDVVSVDKRRIGPVHIADFKEQQREFRIRGKLLIAVSGKLMIFLPFTI